MRLLLNVIWLIFAGFWMALGYAIAGLVMCILIITIPFGIQAFKLASFALWPFGREVIRERETGALSVIGNVIWVVLAGIWLAIGHILTAIPLALTIIGLPLAWANIKMVPVSLMPFGAQIVTAEEAAAHHLGAGFAAVERYDTTSYPR
jgi:uncharacterized membrane protein YccF (DUF307 family)